MVFSEKIYQQYNALKQESGTDLLVMQVGIFMQVYDGDADLLNEITGVKVSLAGTPDQPIHMAGFPMSGLDKYIGKIMRAGRSIGIATQDVDKQRQITERLTIKNS